MKTIFIIIRKEFRQIFRNRLMLPMIFVMPIVQMLVLVFAATMEVRHIDLLVVDSDNSTFSQRLTGRLKALDIYSVRVIPTAGKEAEDALLSGDADAILTIPDGFEKDMITGRGGTLQLRLDAVNGMAAGIISEYSGKVILQNLREWTREFKGSDIATGSVDIIPRYWYNEELNYKHYMLPGILVILVTAMGMLLSAINLVREKEIGTIEQINVTPIKRYHFIPGKLLPFWIIALGELSFGLTLGYLLFRIPIRGSLVLLFGFTTVYLLAVMGIGLFLATLARTQQQLMFMFFFFMLTFLLMSGLFTPVESMPQWAQEFNRINPFAYFMKVIRMILLKGSGFRDILPEFSSITVYALFSISLAVWRYRKTTA